MHLAGAIWYVGTILTLVFSPKSYSQIVVVVAVVCPFREIAKMSDGIGSFNSIVKRWIVWNSWIAFEENIITNRSKNKHTVIVLLLVAHNLLRVEFAQGDAIDGKMTKNQASTFSKVMHKCKPICNIVAVENEMMSIEQLWMHRCWKFPFKSMNIYVKNFVVENVILWQCTVWLRRFN